MIGETIIVGFVFLAAFHLVWWMKAKHNKRKTKKQLMAMSIEEVDVIMHNAKGAMNDRALTHEERADAQTIYRLCQQISMMARPKNRRIEPTIGSLTDNSKPKKQPSLEEGDEPVFSVTEERVFDEEEVPTAAKENWSDYDEPTYLRNGQDRPLH